ncbi:hypothetical protein BGZ70_009677 [Mortierella alpina]|uniref:Uncharacterized protein n=1 Tax=Mortierella alpina TaxID=64518 RepID=A0A9P6J1E7_MORAP|nr:hypothetical protein BGZ70_009677 [Mortierella alpina]
MTIAHQSASSSDASASDPTAAPATTTPTRHRTRPARKTQSPPPALSIRPTLESTLRDAEESSPSFLQALTASYHNSSSRPQDSTLTSPSASAKTRSSTRLSLDAPTTQHSLGSRASRLTKAVRKPIPQNSDQNPSSANSDEDKCTLPKVIAAAAAAPRVSQSPFLVADEDNHHNAIRDKAKAKAALFWTTRHSNSQELQGLHAETPTKSRIRPPIGDAVPPARRWTRSQALEADLRKKQVARAPTTTGGGGGLESDDGDDGDDEGSEASDTPLLTDGGESPIPRTPSKITALVAGTSSSRPAKDDDDDDSIKDDAANQHMLRMRILGVHARTQSNTGSFKRRVAAVTGYETNEDNEDQYEQECSDGDRTPIPRTPSKRMKPASDLQGLDARSLSSPGSWLERWKLNTMMNHSSMKPPKASQEDLDPTEVLPATEPSEAVGFATPKRKRTVFLEDLDQAPPRPTIDGHIEGDEEFEGQEVEDDEEEEEERSVSDAGDAHVDVCTPVKTHPLRLDLADMTDLQTVPDPKQEATADFQTPPHKQVRKDLFGQDMRPPPAPRGLSSGRRPMYFENMGTSSPIAQKTLHLHRPPSEW